MDKEMGLVEGATGSPRRFPLLGTFVNALSLDETVVEIEKAISSKKPTQHVVLNASKINLMRQDYRLAQIVNECPLINADGASIVWAAKLLGLPVLERVSGIDLFLRLIELAAEKGYGVYLFGATQEVVVATKDVLEKKNPGLRIVGIRNGYFDDSDNSEIVEAIAESGADMLFVAFSSPLKEYWIHDHLKELGVPFAMGVGGSFDVVAGVTSRAPKWMQDHGLEWLYRLIQEPRRLWRRYLVGNLKFIAVVFKWKMGVEGNSDD